MKLSDISIFANLYSTKPMHQVSISFDELTKRFSQPIVRSEKNDLPLFAPVVFKAQKNRIINDNIKGRSLIVLDVDGLELFEFLPQIAKYPYIVYNTFTSFSSANSGKESKNWRVIIQTTMSLITSPVFQKVVGSLAIPIKTSTSGGIDSACFDPARRFFLPAVPSDKYLNQFVFLTHTDKSQSDFSTRVMTHPQLEPEPVMRSALSITQKELEVDAKLKASIASLGFNNFSDFDYQTKLGAGMRHSGMLKAATRILFEMHSTAKYELFFEKVLAYDKEYCVPSLSAKSAELKELQKIALDVYSKFKEFRGSAKVVEQKILNSPQVKECIESYIAKLNCEYTYIVTEKRVFRFKYRDYISWQDFLNETANCILELPSKQGVRKLHMGKIWRDSPERNVHLGVVFAPGEELIVNDRVNLWKGWGVEPQRSIAPRTLDYEQMFNDFMTYIFEDNHKERDWFVQWLAYPIKHPGAKLFSAVLLWGAHGSGKTLMGEIIGRIYGENYKNIDANMLTLPFNDWRKNLQFVCGDEISTHGNKRTHNDALKHLITGTTFQVNEKFQPSYTLRNCANFLFTSNHANAIALEQTERRFFVWEMPAINSKLLRTVATVFLTQDGAAALMHYLLGYDTSSFNPVTEPLHTKATDDMIDTVRSDIEAFLIDIKTDGILGSPFKSEVVTLSDIKTAYSLFGGHVTVPAIKNALYRTGNNYALKRELKMAVPGTQLRRTMRLVPLTNINNWRQVDNDAWRDEYLKQIGG